MLLHQWTFNGDARDQVGTAHGTLSGGALLEGDGRISLNNGQMLSQPIDQNIGAKTLVSWVSLNDLDAGRGGSALSLGHTAGLFDGIVYAEIEARKWMSGSNGFARTQNPQTFGTPETVTEPGEVMMAIVYDDQNGITLYRDGELYGNYTTSHLAQIHGGRRSSIDRPAAPRDGRIGRFCQRGAGVQERHVGGPDLGIVPSRSLDDAQPAAATAAGAAASPFVVVRGRHGERFGWGGARNAEQRRRRSWMVVCSSTGSTTSCGRRRSERPIEAKTLMAWVSLDNLQQQAGSALTLERFGADDVFDGIVYGERVAGQWMAGSNFFLRSVPDNGGAAETVGEPGEVMVAIVYDEDNSIRIYRDGELYAVASQGGLESYPAGVSDVLIGLRHEDIGGGMGTVNGPDPFLAGFVNEARIYQGALSDAAIRDGLRGGTDSRAEHGRGRRNSRRCRVGRDAKAAKIETNSRNCARIEVAVRLMRVYESSFLSPGGCKRQGTFVGRRSECGERRANRRPESEHVLRRVRRRTHRRTASALFADSVAAAARFRSANCAAARAAVFGLSQPGRVSRQIGPHAQGRRTRRRRERSGDCSGQTGRKPAMESCRRRRNAAEKAAAGGRKGAA